MIELYLLEQLLTFSKCGTLSGASKELHISQPALSHSMQKLEERMGVPLFRRIKNRIVLNENGKLTAEYAGRILKEEQEMIERVRLLDQSRRTITLGSCAPVPVWKLVPLLTELYGEQTIVSEVKNRDEELLEELERGRYQLVVLHEKPEKSGLYGKAFQKERLYLSLPWEHPLSAKSEIRLQEIDGQNLLLYTQIGFWYELCRTKLPNAHFLLMNEYDAFGEVAGIGAFPSFVSDVLMGREEGRRGGAGQKVVPILDPEVDVTYYCVCQEAERKRFAALYRRLEG